MLTNNILVSEVAGRVLTLSGVSFATPLLTQETQVIWELMVEIVWFVNPPKYYKTYKLVPITDCNSTTSDYM